MAKITKSIEIEASPEKVFAFVISDNMNNVWGEWYSGKWISEGPVGIGSIGHFDANPNFLKGNWDMKVTEFEKNKNMVMQTIGKSPMKSTVTMNLEQATKGTKATYIEDYQLPYSVFGKLLDKVKVSKDMEKVQTKLLENLKKALET